MNQVELNRRTKRKLQCRRRKKSRQNNLKTKQNLRNLRRSTSKSMRLRPFPKRKAKVKLTSSLLKRKAERTSLRMMRQGKHLLKKQKSQLMLTLILPLKSKSKNRLQKLKRHKQLRRIYRITKRKLNIVILLKITNKRRLTKIMRLRKLTSLLRRTTKAELRNQRPPQKSPKVNQKKNLRWKLNNSSIRSQRPKKIKLKQRINNLASRNLKRPKTIMRAKETHRTAKGLPPLRLTRRRTQSRKRSLIQKKTCPKSRDNDHSTTN